MDLSLLTLLMPFFALIALGYAAGRLNWIQALGVSGINTFVIRFAMPCLIIRVIANADSSQLFNNAFLFSYLAAELISYLLSLLISLKWFRIPLAESALLAMAAAWGNVGYMGIPLANSLLGSEAALAALLATATDMAVVTGVTVLLVEYDQRNAGLAFTPLCGMLLKKLLSHPFIMTISLGLVLMFSGIGIPRPLEPTLSFLSQAAGPAALFAIGASLSLQPLGGEIKQTAVPIMLKLLCLPLCFYLFANALALDSQWLIAGLLLCALPTAGNVFVLAEQYQCAVQRVSASILLSTVLSLLSLAVLLTLL